MDIIAWIILSIVALNIVAFGAMRLIWLKEGRCRHEKRETGGRDRRPADGGRR